MTVSESLGQSPDGDGSDADLANWAADLADRLKAGEPLDLEAYARDHPERAEELRRLLPTLAMMANIGWPQEIAPPLHPPLGVPEVLGDFKILAEIGRGGMGVVYEAVQLPLDRRVALKVLPRDAALDARQIQRFQVEAQAVASLDHPNIVPIYSIGREQDIPYFAMRLIDGQNLAEIVRELRRIEGPGSLEGDLGTRIGEVTRSLVVGQFESGGETHDARPQNIQDVAPGSSPSRGSEPAPTDPMIRGGVFLRTAAWLASQAAEALAHAHELGVVHRDIKPANLMVDAEGHLWVTDFGVARLQGDSELTRTGDLIGTLRFMSPEQALGRRNRIDARTDIYSLGATLYELLTLRPAFESDDRQELLHRITQGDVVPPRRRNPSIPPDLETIVRKSMAREPGDRYTSAREMADDLTRFLANEAIRARPVGRLEMLRRWCVRPERVRDAGVALVSLGVLMCAIGALTYISYLVRLIHPARPDDLVLDLVVALVVFDVPPIWCGCKALAGKRYGLALGLLTSLNFLFWLIVSLFGSPVLDYGGLYEDLSSRAPFVLLILLLVVHTVVRVAIGLAAFPRRAGGRDRARKGSAATFDDSTEPRVSSRSPHGGDRAGSS